MRRRMKRFLAAAMALTMAFTMTGTSVLAAGNEGSKITPSQSAEETVTQDAGESKPENADAVADAVREYQDNLNAGLKVSYVLDEGFESGIPSDWLNYNAAESYNCLWECATGDHEQSTGAHQGDYNALFDSADYRETAWLVTPKLDLSAGNFAYLSFWYINRAWGNDIEEVQVFYRVNGGAWVELFYTDEAHETWTNVFISLPKEAQKADMQIGFNVIGHYGYGAGLDDVQMISLAEQLSFTLSYNANGGTGTTLDPNSPYLVGELATAIENQFVGPDGAPFICWNTQPNGMGTSYAPGDQLHMTENTTLYAIWNVPINGLNEGFENGIPVNWTVVASNNGNYYWRTEDGNSYNLYAHGGKLNAFISYSTRGDVSWLITPWLDLSHMTGASLRFWYANCIYMSGDDCIDKLGVYYRTADSDWTELFFTEENHEEWTEQMIVMNGSQLTTPIQIGFKATDGWGNGICIDDVSITEIDTGLTQSVTYNANGGSGSTVDETEYYSGQVVTVLENEFTAPEGNYFIEWNTSADGNGISFMPGDTFSISSGLTLYAIWSSEDVVFDVRFTQMPTGWGKYSTIFLYQWIQGEECMMASSTDGEGEGETWLVAPKVDLSDANCAILRFEYANEYNPDGIIDLFVGYNIDGGEWQLLDFTPEITDGEYFVVDVFLPKSLMQQDVQIGFKSVANGAAINMIKSATLTRSLRQDLYGVLIDDSIQNGHVMAKPAYGEAGDQITLTLLPDGGYEVDSLSVTFLNEELTLSQQDDNTVQFTMPTGDVHVDASFVKNAYFVNIADNMLHGTVVADPTYGDEGDQIYLTVTPDGGYMMDTLTITCGSTTIDYAMENGQYVFLMPAGDVTVNCTFRSAAYLVNVSSQITHGTVVASPNYGYQGDEIYLYVTPEIGYELSSLTVTKGSTNITLYEADDHFYFTMPKGNVTVTATFTQVWDVIYYEDFENNGFDPEGWTYYDANEDGYNWYPIVDSRTKCHSGHGALTSASYFIVALLPDNWAFTPAISLPKKAKLSFWVIGQDAGYPDEKMTVYIGTEPDPDRMVALAPQLTGTSQYVNYTYDLSNYADQEVYIAFRHHDSYDLNRINLDDVCIYTDLDDVEREPAVMHYAKAAFDGKLGLAFFIKIPDWLKRQTDAYVTLTQCGETQTRKISDIIAGGTNSDGLYRIALYMPAAYYRDNVTLRLYDAHGQLAPIIGSSSGSDLTETGVRYSLQKCNTSYMNNGDAKLKALAKAMDDYCTATQIYFEHPTEGVTLTLSSAIDSVKQTDLSDYVSIRDGVLTQKISKLGLVGSFEADNSLKLNLTFASGTSSSKVKYYISEDGTMESAKQTSLRGNKTNGYYLVVRNIPAAYLDKTYTFFIVDTETGEVYSIGCSLYTYVRATAFSANYPEDLKNLTKALYLYGKAAKSYFLQ